MDIHTATEIAYKNGYEKGYKDGIGNIITDSTVSVNDRHFFKKVKINKIKNIIDTRCEAELGQVHATSKGGKVTKTVDTSLIAKDIFKMIEEDYVLRGFYELKKKVQDEQINDLKAELKRYKEKRGKY
jgi:hypothetical protein